MSSIRSERFAFFAGVSFFLIGGLFRSVMAVAQEQKPTALREAAAKYDEEFRIRQDRDEYEPETVLQLLEKGVPIAPEDNGGWNVLSWAISCRCQKTITAILKRNPDVNARDKNGRTALMFAAIGSDGDTMRRLFARKADVNLQDRFGMTALMYAAQHEFATDAIPLLLQQKGDRALKDKEMGLTALQRAEYYGNLKAVSLLQTGRRKSRDTAGVSPQEGPNPRIRIDSHRWLSLRYIYDPHEATRYRVLITDRRTHRQGSLLLDDEPDPDMKIFRDTDGRTYLYIESSRSGSIENGEMQIASLYLVKGVKCFLKWREITFSLSRNGTALPGGGAILWFANGGLFAQNDPHFGDWVHQVYRLRNGVITRLNDAVFPGT